MNPQTQPAIPLCVDLDGTLIRTDLLWESVMLLLGKNPLYALLLPFWVLKGRAQLKRMLASRVTIDPASLPYHPEFLAYLRAEYAAGRPLILVTASDSSFANPVAEHLGIFADVMGSDGRHNLKAGQKRAALDQRFGPSGYDYAGNSSADIPVWKGARRAIVVNASSAVSRGASGAATVDQTFPAGARSKIVTLLRGIRVHQWVKNLLVFLPVITSHQIFHLDLMERAALAFIAFSLCASSVYVLNDLLDLRSDRLHAKKRRRPFAAGDLSIPAGLALSVGFLAGAVVTSFLLPRQFQFVLSAYYVLTLAYSLSLKRKVLVDIFTLGGLYTIRVLAGSAATAIEPSAWLLAFCLFFFLSLALLKRFAELNEMKDEGTRTIAGRGYVRNDLPAIGAMGISNGSMCALILALYIQSPQVLPLYHSPRLLWFLTPLILYWMSRMWMLAYRGQMHEDPVLFALRDRMTYITAAFGGAILTLAARGAQF